MRPRFTCVVSSPLILVSHQLLDIVRFSEELKGAHRKLEYPKVRLRPRVFPEKQSAGLKKPQSKLSCASDLSKRRTHGLLNRRVAIRPRGSRAGLARGVHWRSRERPRVDRVGPPEKYPRSDQRLRAREPRRTGRCDRPPSDRGVRTADRVSAQRARGGRSSGRHGRRLQQETRGETRRRRYRR